MKSKISTGIWLISLGIIILLHNFNIIDFNFYSIWKYWPLLLVSLGLNLMLQNRQNGNAILIVFNIIVCLFLTYTGITSKDKFSISWISNKNIETGVEFNETSPSVSTPYTDQIKKATLQFNLGAANIQLNKTTDTTLLTALSNSGNIGLKLETKSSNDHQELILNSAVNNGNDKKSNIQLELNATPIWEFEFNLGAAKFDADFSPYTFSKLEMNAGAASFDLKFGAPQFAKTIIEINTAASSCVIHLPKDAACELEATSLISSKNFDGFQKNGDKLQTENFNSAEKKYYIELNGAVNSIKINRY